MNPHYVHLKGIEPLTVNNALRAWCNKICRPKLEQSLLAFLIAAREVHCMHLREGQFGRWLSYTFSKEANNKLKATFNRPNAHIYTYTYKNLRSGEKLWGKFVLLHNGPPKLLPFWPCCWDYCRAGLFRCIFLNGNIFSADFFTKTSAFTTREKVILLNDICLKILQVLPQFFKYHKLLAFTFFLSSHYK